MHALDVISLGLYWEKIKEFSFFCFKVDWWGTLGEAAWWVWPKTKEVTEDIWGSGLLIGSPLGISSSSWGRSVLKHSYKFLWASISWFQTSVNLLFDILNWRIEIANATAWPCDSSWLLHTGSRRWLLDHWGSCNNWLSWWLNLWKVISLWWKFVLWRCCLGPWWGCWLLWLLLNLHWKSSFYHWELFIIFTKISIEFVIINIIEKSDPLSKSLTNSLVDLNISKVLNIERNSSNLWKRIVHGELPSWGKNLWPVPSNDWNLTTWLIDHSSCQLGCDLGLTCSRRGADSNNCSILVDIIDTVLWLHILSKLIFWIELNLWNSNCEFQCFSWCKHHFF